MQFRKINYPIAYMTIMPDWVLFFWYIINHNDYVYIVFAILFRHIFHHYPDMSNNVYLTSERIACFIETLNPDETIALSKTGKVFVFDSNESGGTLMFRTELNPLPIIDISDLPYCSVNKGIAHSCGHDRHTAIIETCIYIFYGISVICL